MDLRKTPILARYAKMREELLSTGDLIQNGNGMGMLRKSISFSNPSGAADFILGGSNNGWIEWKDSSGQTLDALYRR